MPRFVVQDHIVVRKIGDEYFLLDRSVGQIRGLNETGYYVISSVKNGLDTGEILEHLNKDYEIDDQSAADDLNGFLTFLKKLGIVKEKRDE